MKILFYDCASPFSYDSKTFQTNAIGGTEATVIRVAEALSNYHDITVAQKYRTEVNILTKVKYVPLDYPITPDIVVCVRKIDEVVKRFGSNTKIHVLCQNFDEDLIEIRAFLRKTNGFLISVSDHLLKINKKLLPDIHHMRIYNPIDDNLIENDTPRDKNKLVFFSSPHKGLFDTLYVFNLMRSALLPQLTLYYSNPGYIDWPHQTTQNAINLGCLPYEQIIKHVRESFCVFYINKIFPETFGLIYAEANAVGTPVLTHDHGAAREILHPNNPIIDCNYLPNVRDTFTDWYLKGAPEVAGVQKFRISNVLQDWLVLFLMN